ncbi:Ser-Thr-rich glycosyl-phosphatidyl-inositol-anchored membrane family-domain-containing protein [Hypoxylon rubiginosum]|uniref:Ser-Thr-rich glycosyl-phosphatidyl-inositol-anchored membrane family-domain-containing protein n=1 Tax=Hypoxylon rubiginosum TaxID=110542 RepID=A0ACC0DKH6_9PEZI|nr:Ser-Thr-rich glycosyl-phosphatidyl-inositol-anchored membrane family-domain-containing protein [Hypoxylon rubiginosum]
MRSSTVFASALAFAASVFAQTDGYAVMTSPTKGASVPSGKTFTIVWEAGKYTGDATISLLGGDSPTTLVPGATLGTVDVAAGSFDWPVDCSLGKEKTYGIKITSAASPETFQYSFPFAISGPSCSSGAGSYPTLSSSVLISSSSTSTSTKSSSTSSASSSTTTSTVETTSTSTSSTTVISSYVAITSAANNLSTTAVPTYSGTTILTTTSAAVVTPTGSSTTTSSVPVATGAANSAAAGSFALVGALAFAVMAM